MEKKEKIKVIIEYVGESDWQDDVPPDSPLSVLKIHALKHFEIEAGQKDKYVLQYHDVDIADEHKKVGTFNVNPLRLKLTLKEETPKGR